MKDDSPVMPRLLSSVRIITVALLISLPGLASINAWAVLPPAQATFNPDQPVTIETGVSSKQKPMGPALQLKLSSAQTNQPKPAALKPVTHGKSSLAYQTRLQNPNNPYGRSTFPIEPDDDETPVTPTTQPVQPAARPAILDEADEKPSPQSAVQITPSAQPTQTVQPVKAAQQRTQPAPPVWPAQTTAAQTPTAKAPVIDPWRQAQPVPEGTTPTLAPVQAGNTATEGTGTSFNLQTQKGALARTYMFRQLTPKPYKSYTVSVKALMASLHDTFVYLRDLNGELPDLQRLSAFQARVRVEWLAFQKRLPPDAEKFSSYKSIEVAVAELDAMTAYWINRNRVKRVYQGTLDQQYTDEQLFQTRVSNLKNSLANLESLAQTEREVVREVPYAY